MGIQALWTIDFVSIADAGPGVLVFQNGRIFGGDAQYYYLGRYEFEVKLLWARVHAHHYAGTHYSIFGPRSNLTLELFGNIRQDGTLFCSGTVVEAPEMGLDVIFERQAALPD